MARFNGGWIKLYREAFEGDLGDSPFLLGIFIKLLVWANWKESSAKFKGERIKLQPGQLLTGLRELSPDKEEDPYLHRVRNALAYLEKRGTIAQAASNQGRLITICNWSEYQTGADEPSKQSASEAQADRKQSANAPQLSEEEKKEERRERGDGFTPENLAEAEATWVKTLAKFGIDKPADFDRDQIIRLIQRYGFEKTNMALLGAGFEEKGGDFDPSNHVNIRRLTDKPAIFDKFVNLGAKNKPTEEKVTEWKVKL